MLRRLISTQGCCNMPNCTGCPIRTYVCGVIRVQPPDNMWKEEYGLWKEKVRLCENMLLQIAESNPEFLLEELL